MKACHHNNIERIRHSISDHDKRTAFISKGANAHFRIACVEAKKRRLIRQLDILETGWKEIAPVLFEESRKLFSLPRELREKIYGYLYRNSSPDELLELSFPDFEVRESMLPRDP